MEGAGVVSTVVELLKTAARILPERGARKPLVTRAAKHTEANHSERASGSHLTARLGLLPKAQVA